MRRINPYCNGWSCSSSSWKSSFGLGRSPLDRDKDYYCKNHSRGYAAKAGCAPACASSSLKVAILGANCITGRSLALSLKQSCLVDELSIYDHKPSRGMLLELGQLGSNCRTVCHGDSDMAQDLSKALMDAKIVVVITTGSDVRQEADDLRKLTQGIIEHCPKALVALVSRSVNSLLPMLFELYKQSGLFQWNRLFGVLNLFSTRANSLAAEALAIDPEFVSVPIIGGGCTKTCVPLFSRTRPCAEFTPEELNKLTLGMRDMAERVDDAQRREGSSMDESSALALGFSAARFCVSLCKALRDQDDVVECAYVRSCLLPELKYFGSPLRLGPCGVQKQLGVPRLHDRECRALVEAVPEIAKAIALGESLALGEKRSTEICPAPSSCAALERYHHQPQASNVTV
ncbi:hypothetical protein QAD02_011889 [Eretmocerus hayati]|uniref:Uncharacterized protein n=1 Tax=Eretmocerus hayati TaxID=131215 RepID=A0ACC2NY08_9HYME|nr:hypothetical protein QAD02_011889 [Eretmocerus hayati]